MIPCRYESDSSSDNSLPPSPCANKVYLIITVYVSLTHNAELYTTVEVLSLILFHSNGPLIAIYLVRKVLATFV